MAWMSVEIENVPLNVFGDALYFASRRQLEECFSRYPVEEFSLEACLYLR